MVVQAFNQLTNLLSERLVNGLSTVSDNRYTLTVDGLLSPISILNVEGEEQLNQLGIISSHLPAVIKLCQLMPC